MATPIDWSAIEDALHAWIETATASLGIPAENIVWSDQDAPEPDQSLPTLVVRRGDLVSIAPAYVQSEFDEDRAPNADGTGREWEEKATFQKVLTISVQAFDSRKVGDVTGPAILGVVQNALELPSVRDALLAVGLVPYGEPDVIRNLSALEGADFESRAATDVQFLLTDAISSFVGYIDTVEVTQTTEAAAPVVVTIEAEE